MTKQMITWVASNVLYCLNIKLVTNDCRVLLT
jgi:hypothetical protein